jgi:hypothetical protein
MIIVHTLTETEKYMAGQVEDSLAYLPCLCTDEILVVHIYHGFAVIMFLAVHIYCAFALMTFLAVDA